MTQFFRYPSIPYMARPTGLAVREDKVLTPEERAEFLSHELLVEEKIDGENLGISTEDGQLCFQARGSYVDLGGTRFQGLEAWVRPRESRILEALGTELILFGEWCTVQHTVRYEALPDWFLLFDVYDRSERGFWENTLRDELAEEIGLQVVPLVGVGHFTYEELQDLIGVSRLGSELSEGVVARVTDEVSGVSRAKLVRPAFTQSIGEHWMRGHRHHNRLAFA